MSDEAPFDFVLDGGYWRLSPEGGDYETRSAAVYFDHLGFCGCGDPDAARLFIARLLTENPVRFDDGKPRPCSHDDTMRLIRDDPDGAAWVLLYMLDKLGLTEHGGSVNGAWLTPRGEQVAELFASEPFDPGDE